MAKLFNEKGELTRSLDAGERSQLDIEDLKFLDDRYGNGLMIGKPDDDNCEVIDINKLKNNMRDFKKGDKVKCKKDNYEFSIDEICTVTGLDDDGYPTFENESGRTNSFYQSQAKEDFELVDKTITSKFKVGDKVPFEPNKNSKELGIDTSRKFVAVGDHYTLKKGTIIHLKRDDNSRCPFFWNEDESNYSAAYWKYLAYANDTGYDEGTGYDERQLPKLINKHNIIEKTMSTIKRVPNTLKRVLDPELKAQYKAGFINGDLELTDRGLKHLNEIAALHFRKTLAEDAVEWIKDHEDKD